MLRWLRYSRESQARHTFTSSITSCTLTDTTLAVTDLTHLQLTPRLLLPAFFFFHFFFLAARHPVDIDSVSYRWCPDTEHVIFDDIGAVLASVLFLSKNGGYRLVVVFFLLDCI